MANSEKFDALHYVYLQTQTLQIPVNFADWKVISLVRLLTTQSVMAKDIIVSKSLRETIIS